MDYKKIYTDIEDLPLYNFDKIDTTGDLMWLYEDFNGRQAKIDTTDLKPIYDNIFNQYFIALDDKSIELRIQKEAKIQILMLKYNTVVSILNRISLGFESDAKGMELRGEYLKRLRAYKYDIVETQYDFNTHYDDIVACQKVAKKLDNINVQIAIIRNELKKYQSTQTVRMQKQLYVVSKTLFNGVPIKPKEVSTAWWVEALIDMRNLQESQEKNKDGK